MRHSIIVSKGGSCFFTREEARKTSSSGEQGETEGLLRHLLENPNLQVVYFGYYRGEVLDGLTVVEPTSRGLDEWSLETEQEARFRQDEENLESVLEGTPIAFFNVAGYAPTFSCIGNPKGVTVQQCNVLYTAPMLNAIRHFKAPRIVVNNDPRSYPKDQEMTLMWDEVRPAALLDQRNLDTSMVVGGRQYRRRSVWAKCESWAWLPSSHDLFSSLGREFDCMIVAHAHMTDGTRQKGRNDTWQQILNPREDVIELRDKGMRVYGAGWTSYDEYDEVLMPGKIRPDEVINLMSNTFCCPITACGSLFYTGKPYLLLSCGCLPILYGDGIDPYTWDPYGVHLPLSSDLRIFQPGDLKKQVKYHVDNYTELLPMYRERFPKDFTVLDRLTEDLMQGRNWHSDEWFHDYGGYR